MSKRESVAIRRCNREGCKGNAVYTYSSQKERREADVWYAKHPYLCIRHRTDTVLSLETPERTATLVSEHATGLGLFWNGEKSVAFGEGFKAFADDFPSGTKLIITARIEIPE